MQTPPRHAHPIQENDDEDTSPFPRPPPLQIVVAPPLPSTASSSVATTFEPQEMTMVRTELERLVSQDEIPKHMALEIMKLHHRMETCLMKLHTECMREVDRLHHSVSEANLKSEVHSLTLRQSAHEQHIEQLQTANEQLQSLAMAPPSKGGRRS